MVSSLRGTTPACVLVLGLAASFHSAAASAEEKLSEFDFLLVGLEVRPEPALQTVPRNTATGIRISVELSNGVVDPASVLSLLPGKVEVAGELIGPGLAPVVLRGKPGELLPIPPLSERGLYHVRDVRLETETCEPDPASCSRNVLVRGTPDTATLEVIDRVLVSKVVTRPLTADEIRQKGILFGDDSFQAFNFTLALSLDSRPVTLELPVVFDGNDIPVPVRSTQSLQLQGLSLPIPGGASVVPVMMSPDPDRLDPETLAQIPREARIPGMLVIPGNVGYLNQFFSALLIVSNGAPTGSNLTASALTARIELPSGEDGDPGDAADNPLRLAPTELEPIPLETRSVMGRGPDAVAGTADDTSRFRPGEQGEAEFLVEGLLEGFHEVAFDIFGTLEGLPVGPIPVRGRARGGVLVRNPDFQLTFSAPATVRTGDELTLFITVSNVSDALANFVFVDVPPSELIGARLALGEESRKQILEIPPREARVVSYRFEALTTGQVNASYLNVDGADGDLLFHLGVDERGVPLSPDTLVLPDSVRALRGPNEPANEEPAVVREAVQLLGLAWSNATAPAGTLPEEVLPISRESVLDRATELAEAGLRVEIGEPLERALFGLALSWVGAEDAGFEQLVRGTTMGADLLAALGSVLSSVAPEDVGELQRRLAGQFSSAPAHLLVGTGSGAVGSPLALEVADPAGGAVTAGRISSLAGGAFLPLTGEPGNGMALVPRLDGSFYEVRLTALRDDVADVTLNVPRPDGSVGFYRFEDVVVSEGMTGTIAVDLLRERDTLTLLLDRGGVAQPPVPSSPVEILESGGPVPLAATLIGPETLAGADPWGRVLALLFDRELDEGDASFAGNYVLEKNEVVSALRQLSGRLVFLFLRDPVGELVPRQVEIRPLFDAKGRPMDSPVRLPITSRLEDAGAIVSGRVTKADGTPLTNAEIHYRNHVQGAGLIPISAKRVEPDGTYSFDWVRQSPSGGFSIRATDPETGGIQELSTRVREDGEHIALDLVLLGRGGVRGVVRDLDGAPVPGASVLVKSQADPANAFVVEADGNGFYEVTGMVVGTVSVKAVFETSVGTASGIVARAGTFTTIDVSVNRTAGGSVSGTVLERGVSGDIEGLPDVEVFFAVPSPGSFGSIVVDSTRTDPTGAFTFTGMPVGEFQVVAFDAVRNRRVSSPVSTLLAASPHPDVSLVFFDRGAVGAVQGRVLDAGEAVAGALVQGLGRLLETDGDGFYRFEDVPKGTHVLTAFHPAGDRKLVRNASIASDGETGVVDFNFPGRGTVRVTVLDPRGQPLKNHPVFRLVDNPCAGIQVFTDAVTGEAVFETAVGGSLFKSFLDADVASGSASVKRHGDDVSLVLRFAGFGRVTGVVRDAEGKEVFGADVVLKARRFDQTSCELRTDLRARQLRTGVDGRFAFDAIPLGEVTVSATRFTSSTPATAKDVLIADGDVRDFELRFTDEVPGRITGTVFLSDGETPAGAGVRVSTSASTGADLTVTTKEDGSFAFAKILAAGRYELTATDPATGKVARTWVVLAKDQDVSTSLRLLGKGSVRVEVRDGLDRIVEEAFVEVKGASFPFDEAASALTPDDGGVLRFDRIGEGRFTATVTDPSGLGGRADGVITEDGEVVDVVVRLTVTGKLRGVYRSAPGPEPQRGIPNAEVRLKRGLTGSLLGSIISSPTPVVLDGCDFGPGDTTGGFAFDHVPAGTVLVTATDPLTGRIGEASAKIETQDQLVCLEVVRLGRGTVSGRILDDTDQGLPGATVTITSTTGLSSLPNFEATATADSEGGFVFEGVPVGNFILEATFPALLVSGIFAGSVDTDGQAVTGIELRLEPSVTLAGTVLDADGLRPVPGASLTLKLQRGALLGVSDAEGSFEFQFVPVGSFSLLAEELGGGDAGILEGLLEAGSDVLDAEVLFNGTGRIEGTAFQSDGVTPLTPLDGALLRLTRAAPFARSETTAVGPDGAFRFFDVPVGGYTLSVTASVPPFKGAASGTIDADGAVDAVSVSLQESRAVTGRMLRDADTHPPAANAHASLQLSGFTLTDLAGADGRFRIDAVPLGDFELTGTDSLTEGLARVSGTISATSPEPVDLGDLILDAQPIAVASLTPANGATDVPPDRAIVVEFTDPVLPESVPGRVLVHIDGVSVGFQRTISDDGRRLTVSRSSFWPPRNEIAITFGRDLKDTLGRPMGEDVTSRFETGGAVVTGILTSALGAVEGATVTLLSDPVRTAVSDGDGRYRIENAPVGTFSLTAVLGEIASAAVVTIDEADALVGLNLELHPSGSISGLVTLAGGSAAPSGLPVTVLRGTTPVFSTATGPDGRYAVPALPLDVVWTVDVTNPANGDRGRTTATLTTDQRTPNDVDVSMLGLGSVRVRVVDSEGALVDDPDVSLRYHRFGQPFVASESSPDGDAFRFDGILSGEVTAEVRAHGRTVTSDATVMFDDVVTAEIVFPSVGSIAGKVYEPDGVTEVAGALVELYRSNGAFVAEATSTGLGFSFDELAVSDGPYRIDARVDGVLRGRKRDVAVRSGETTPADLTLVGLGTVTGTVFPPAGTSLSDDVRVTLTSLSPDFARTIEDRNAADGEYRITGVPVGRFTLTARDHEQGFVGEASGEMTVDGGELDVPVSLVSQPFTFPSNGQTLFDANEAGFRIHRGGEVDTHAKTQFDSPGALFLDVSVNRGGEVRFLGESLGSREESERELVTATADIDGLSVHRKIYVPEDGYFARYLEIFRNVSGAPLDVSARVSSNLVVSSGKTLDVVDTSGATPFVSGSPYAWIVTDDEVDADPFLDFNSRFSTAWITGGGTEVPATVDFVKGGSRGTLDLYYELSLDAGESAVLMHFVSQELFAEAARAAAERLVRLPPEALAGLSLEEIATIANFDVPADGASSVAPLPPRDGSVAGTLLAHDGIHPIGSFNQTAVTVSFQSEHILFRRTRSTSNGRRGEYNFRDFFIPRTDFTLSATPLSFVLRTVTATASGSFDDRVNWSTVPGALASASSVASAPFAVEHAFDGDPSTRWMGASGHTVSQGAVPIIEMTLPDGVEATVDAVSVDTFVLATGEIQRVRIELLGSGDAVLLEKEVTLRPPDRDAIFAVEPAVGGVRGARLTVLEDAGGFASVSELAILGPAGEDVGAVAVRDLVFHGTSAIEGTTRLGDGTGVESSLVFTNPSFVDDPITEPDGRFFFAPIPNDIGSMNLRATVRNNTLLRVDTKVEGLGPETTVFVDVVYAPTSEVTGRVLRASGEAVEGVTVSLSPGNLSDVTARAGDPEGELPGTYRIPNVPTGSYTLRVSDGARTLTQPLTVNGSDPVTEQDLLFPHFGDVLVTVEIDDLESKTPAVGASVQIRDGLDTFFRNAGTTNALGQRPIANVAEGPYTLRIFHPQNPSISTDLELAMEPTLPQPILEVVTLRGLGTVRGVVTFADDTTAGNVTVELLGGGIATQSVRTHCCGATRGQYSFTNRLELGRPFSVRATHPANANIVVVESRPALTGASAEAVVDLTFPPVGSVRVTVRDAGGNGIASARVEIRDSSSADFVFKGTTNAAGELLIPNVPAGPFAVRALSSGVFLGEESGEIVAHGEDVSILIVRDSETVFEGTIFAGDGETPVDGAEVRLEIAGDRTLSTASDETGSYRFEHLLGEGAEIVVRAAFGGEVEVESDVVVVDQPGGAFTIDLALPIAVVTGRVLEADGATAVAGASVALLSQGLGRSAASSTTSDVDGAFALLAEGVPVELVAEDAFGVSGRVRLVVPEGVLAVDRDVVLPDVGAVTGIVTDASGAPLDGDVTLTNANLLAARATRASAGQFRFDRVALGSFTVIHDMPTGELDRFERPIVVPGSVTGRLTLPGEEVEANVQIPPVGALFGDVLEGGVAIVPDEGSRTVLEGRDHEATGGTYARESEIDGAGGYLQESLPTGEVTVTALHGGAAGAAVAAVEEGQMTRRDVSIGSALEPPVDLSESTIRHEVTAYGALIGTVRQRPELALVRVNQKPFPGLASFASELSGRQLVLGPVRVGGIRHTRRIFAPAGLPFVRYLEILENPAAVEVEVTVELEGQTRFGSALFTSSGDSRLDAGDRWMSLDFGDEMDDATAVLVFAGAGNVRAPDRLVRDEDAGSCRQVWHRLTIPAGGRVLLLHFLVQDLSEDAAWSRAAALVDPELGGLDANPAFSDLTPEERADIVNFVLVTP